MGRRQVVRQRILIPSCGGSNPPAPAIDSRRFRKSAGRDERRFVSRMNSRQPRDINRGRARATTNVSALKAAGHQIQFSHLNSEAEMSSRPPA